MSSIRCKVGAMTDLQDFELGAGVKLKHGESPVMTVIEKEEKDVRCVWFADAGNSPVFTSTFPIEALMRADGGPPATTPAPQVSSAKQSLLEEAAFILEQEGWLVGRAAHDTSSGRLTRFATRYTAWQAKVKSYRESHPGEWQEPPDNS
jgi:uncharacterized protein YodC (DUF2158 family)